MRSKFGQRITSIILAAAMLGSSPGSILSAGDYTLYAQESTDTEILSAASDVGTAEGAVIDPASAVTTDTVTDAVAADTGQVQAAGEVEATQEAVTAEITTPETAAPETTALETTAPETTAPETAAPETAAPETTAAETVYCKIKM